MIRGDCSPASRRQLRPARDRRPAITPAMSSPRGRGPPGIGRAVGACWGWGAGNPAGIVVPARARAPAPRNDAAGAEAADTNAAATVAPYRANGTEPFWALTIAGGQIIYQPMEGA